MEAWELMKQEEPSQEETLTFGHRARFGNEGCVISRAVTPTVTLVLVGAPTPLLPSGRTIIPMALNPLGTRGPGLGCLLLVMLPTPCTSVSHGSRSELQLELLPS